MVPGDHDDPRLRVGGTADEEEVTDELEDGDASGDPDSDLGDEGQAPAGPDGDDPGREDHDGSDEGQAGQRPAEVRQRSRGENRYQALSNRARDAEEKAGRLERELNEFRQSSQRNNGADLSRQREEKRQQELARAAEHDRANGTGNYWQLQRQFDREDMDARLAQIEARSLESNDRVQFEAMANARPDIFTAKFRDQIEQRRSQEYRETGVTFPRSTVAKFLLGDMALERGAAAKTRQQNRADQSRQRETVRTPRNTPRGDVPRTRTTSNDQTARADRLKDQLI
jgi:hypothetical protein